jgi:hypothetical protein
MIARMIAKNPREGARFLFKTAMLFLGTGLAWPRFVPVTGNLGQDAIDGVRGLLLGIGIALALWAALVGGRLRRGTPM